MTAFFARNNAIYEYGTTDLGGGVGGGNSEDDEEEEEEEESESEFVLPPDVEERHRELGEPTKRAQCFGCRFIGENNMAALPHERLREVLTIISQGISKSCPIALSLEVAAKYAEIRLELLKQYDDYGGGFSSSPSRLGIDNSSGDSYEISIPEWSAATILEHFYYHNTDPEIQQWLHLDRLQKTMRLIEEESMIVKNKKSRKRKIDKDQFNIWATAMKTWYTVSSKDASKLAFYNEGLHFDSKAASTGILETQGKPLYSFFKKRRGL